MKQNQVTRDNVPLPEVLKWKTDLIVENDLQFNPSACGAELFISDNNFHLKKNINSGVWCTCRGMNCGWTEGVHYWSIRINDRAPDGHIMIGIVTEAFDVSTNNYPGLTNDSFGFYVNNAYKYNNASSAVFTSDVPKTGDVIGVLLDLNARTLTYFKNGQIIGTAYGLLPVNGTTIKYYPAVGLCQLGAWVNFSHTTR